MNLGTKRKNPVEAGFHLAWPRHVSTRRATPCLAELHRILDLRTTDL